VTLTADAVSALNVLSVDRGPSHRAEQVEKLRRQMASVSEKMAGRGGGAASAATFGPGAASAATFGPGAASAATFGPGAASAATFGPGAASAATFGPGAASAATFGPGAASAATFGPGAASAATFGPGNHRAAPTLPQLSPNPDSLLPTPDSLAELLAGPLPRGTVAVLSGARSLELSMVAAVTAQGGHAAIIGQPDIGLLAAVEMGADLSRVAVIPEPGADPVEVAAVLLDGMDLVVLGLGGRSVPATRARAVVARARQRGCTLLVTDGEWQGASARLDAHVSGYEVVGAGRGAPTPGCGRIGRVRLTMRAGGRSAGPARALGG